MLLKRTNVKSTRITSIGYDKKSKILEIEFTNTKSVYRYYNISIVTYNELMESNAICTYFDSFIRESFRYTII